MVAMYTTTLILKMRHHTDSAVRIRRSTATLMQHFAKRNGPPVFSTKRCPSYFLSISMIVQRETFWWAQGLQRPGKGTPSAIADVLKAEERQEVKLTR